MSNDYEIKDSGARQSFDTGAVRDTQAGKGRFDLLPMGAIRRLAIHFEKGAKKYGDRNWEKGIPLDRYMDSALRHLASYMEGRIDEDHLVAAAWNLLCALQTESWIAEGRLPDSLQLTAPAQDGPLPRGWFVGQDSNGYYIDGVKTDKEILDWHVLRPENHATAYFKTKKEAEDEIRRCYS